MKMIAKNVRRQREKLGISQDRLSKLSDLSLNTVVKIESGKNANPTIATLSKISKALKVSVDSLLAAAFLLGILSAGTSVAAEAKEERVITITQGIQKVLSDSRVIRISLWDDERTYQNSLLARSSLLPRLSGAASEIFQRDRPASRFGAQVVPTGEKDSFSYGVEIYQTLFDFGKSLFAYRASREAWAAQRAGTEGVRRVSVLEFIIAYFNALESEQMVEVAEKEVESLSAYLGDIEHAFDQGVVVKNDLLPVKVRLADARQKLIAAQSAKELSFMRLNDLLSLPLREKVLLNDVAMRPSAAPSREEAWKVALVQRPEIAFWDDQIRAADQNEKAKAAGNLPDLYAAGGYSVVQNKYLEHEDNAYVKLGARIDLYDGGATKAQQMRERAVKRQMEEQRAKIAEDIKLEIEEGAVGLKDASEKVLVAEEALAQAEENVRVTRVRYAEGAATTTDVLEAITLRTRAATNRAANDYALKRNYAQWMYSMGMDLTLIYEMVERRQHGPSRS